MGARRSGKRKSNLYWIFLASFLAAAAAIFYSNPIALQSLRYIVFDGYQRFAPAPRPDAFPVRIVDIDEDSLLHLGQWPWPRASNS